MVYKWVTMVSRYKMKHKVIQGKAGFYKFLASATNIARSSATVITILLLINILPAEAQDAFLSQHYSNSIYLNPAFAGTSHMARFSMGYRNQFPAMGSTFVNYHAAFDMPSNLLQGGLGINIMNDVLGNGTLHNLAIDGIYSYALVVNPEFTINAGFQASYVMRLLKTDGLIFPDGIDNLTGIYLGPNEEISDQTVSFPDFAVGFLGYTRTWYAGVVVHHLARPNISFSRNYREPLPRKYTIHAGLYIPIFEKRFGREAVRINPNLVVIQQGSQRQINLGAEVIRKVFFAGISTRQNIHFGLSTITIVAGYHDERMRFGYSFDFNMAKPWVSNVGNGAHEIAFIYRFEYKTKSNKKFKAIKCPKI